MKLYRSALFVPGHKPDLVPKAIASGADLLILDLEDACPQDMKVAARAIVRRSIEDLHARGQPACVRINGLVTGMAMDDLEAIVCPELTGVRLPKTETAADQAGLDAMLTHLERRSGMEAGSIEVYMDLETAKAMRNAYDIVLASPRVKHLSAGCAPGGDAARAVGFKWSKAGTETLYLRSKAVLDARAAGIEFPVCASWFDIKDLEGLRKDAELNRQLGFRGMTLIHPSHVPVVNEVFTPSADELAYAKGLIQAMREAEGRGDAAVIYEGDMVDYAMAVTAQELLDLAAEIGDEV